MRALRLLCKGMPAICSEGDLMKRVLALDVGDRRTGVAVSDDLGITAQGVETIETRGIERDVARAAEIARNYGTDRILIGLPRHLDNREGAQAQHSREFGDRLTAMGFSVLYEDERLTTAMAQRALLEADTSRKKRKQVVDKIAAVLILQGFLDAGGWPCEEDKEEKNMEGAMERDNIVELYDEDDNLVQFEHVMTVEHEGSNYVLLAPIEDDEESDEVIILRIEEQDGEEVYASLEDDDLINAVFSKYLEYVEADEDEN